MSYVRYRPDDSAKLGPAGWDAWAKEYATLGATNSVYALGKELLHEQVARLAPGIAGRTVLDFNCGAGDDLARFLKAGWSAVGCDGSAGMLQAAAARNPAELASGRLELWQGRAETLQPGSFDQQRFDLVFSTTGGFAYLDDQMFVRVHRVLASMLKPGGVMIIAHLTPFCLAESVYHLLRFRLGRVVERWNGKVPITVKGENLMMRLRAPGHVRQLLSNVVEIERVKPLLWCTPPFQSGFAPGPRLLHFLRRMEYRFANVGPLAALADQAVVVARPFSKSANKAR